MKADKVKESLKAIRDSIEPLVGRSLSDLEVTEAVFNMSGLANVLLKMKREADEYGKRSIQG